MLIAPCCLVGSNPVPRDPTAHNESTECAWVDERRGVQSVAVVLLVANHRVENCRGFDE